jgi:hypothetical protein
LAAGALSIAANVAIPAAADPPSNGCATGNRSSDVQRGVLHLAVADLAPLGYHVPGLVDDPANGGSFVCAIPLGNQTSPRGNQLWPASGSRVRHVPGSSNVIDNVVPLDVQLP